MIRAQAKAVALQSLQAGRIRAKEAALRVVSYVVDRMAPPRPSLTEITKFVTEALLNPGHEARLFPRIHKAFRSPGTEEFLQRAIDEGRIKIKL